MHSSASTDGLKERTNNYLEKSFSWLELNGKLNEGGQFATAFVRLF